MKILLAIQYGGLLAVMTALSTPSGRAQSGPPPLPPLPPGEMLNMWEFQTTNFLSLRGDPPSSLTNVALVESWNGNSLQVDSTNAAWISYPMVEADGRTNLALHGTVAMWFSGDWNTGDDIGNWGTLLEIGSWTTNLTSAAGAFGLYVSSDGSSLWLSAQTNGWQTNFCNAAISWNAGDWHQIVATYGTNTELYLDGALATTGSGISLPPGLAAFTNTFSVGSDGNASGTGLQQARGVFANLVTYNYQLDATSVSNNFADESQNVSPLPASGGSFTMDGAPSLPGGFSGGTNSPDASTNSPAYSVPTNGLWIQALPLGTNAFNSDPNSLTLILNNTIADIAYQLLSTTNLNNPVWTVEQNLIGSEVTNFTVTTVSMTGRPTLFFKAVSYTLDSDGDGLPDWWETKYSTTSFPLSPTNADTGNTSIPDGYKQDSAGDGYNNLQKYYMNIPPGTWVTPPTPAGFNAVLNPGGTSATLNWNPSPGSVQSYTIMAQDDQNYAGFVTLTNVPASYKMFTDTSSTFGDGIQYEIQANYAGGSSSLSGPVLPNINPNYTTQGVITRGPQGSLYLVVSAVPQNVVAIRVNWFGGDMYYPLNDYTQVNFQDWIPPFYNTNSSYYYYPGMSVPYFDVPVTNLVNGIYQIPASKASPFGSYTYILQGVGADGGTGNIVMAGPQNDWYGSQEMGNTVMGNNVAIPFLDGRTNIQQNINFQLRAATGPGLYGEGPLLCSVSGYNYTEMANTNYVYSGFYFETQYYYWDNSIPYSGRWVTGAQRNEFQPFEESSLYHCFAYTPGTFDANGIPTNAMGVFANTLLAANPSQMFQTYNYVAYSNQAPISAKLDTISSKYIFAIDNYWNYYWVDGNTISFYPDLYEISLDGATGSGTSTTVTFADSFQNIYGLPLQSVEHLMGTGPVTYGNTISGQSYSWPGGFGDDPWFQEYAQPVLSTVGYYFAQPFGVGQYSPFPGDPNFSVTNTTISPMMATLGQPFYLGAWAKQILANGYSGIYAYPQQYFDKAYLADTNGNATTNQTGILSEYGDFFPTQPGQVILTTKPDAATGTTGQCTVNVIKMQLDVNHDGAMDLTFAGPDNTCADRPFQFWINNNFDRYTPDSDGVNYYDDDVQVADCPYTKAPTPDSEYRDFPVGNRIIPCMRDLQDFTRLWVAGITTNLLTNLPSGSTITLSWGDVGSPNYNNPTIDLFQAADADGGLGYLTNSTIASNQIDSIVSPYLGRLGPGQSIQLNNGSQFANGWAGNYFIWCGVTNGTGALTLTIADGSGNTLVQTTANIQIVDIKQMYERWTVGDAPSLGPTNEAYLAAEDLPTPFQYASPTDTNTSYILYVHGWNMERWDKDRFAESAFKRLYWQGYQGRFGSFRWPTYYGFTGSTLDVLTDRRNYDNSEYNAWRSSGGLNARLTDLYIEYHSHVYLFAHSMGNVVAGEALRQQAGFQIVNTYVASQAAVPAHTYDSSITNNIFDLSSPITPNIYTNWFAANSGAAGRRINFYNTNDYALQSSRWELNQVLKPDQSLTVFGVSYLFEGTPYNGFQHYTPDSVDDSSPWLYFVKEQVNATNYLDLLGVLPNRWEAMAYAAQARSTALGRTSGITTMDNTLSLPTIWPLDSTGHSYGDHFWHSAEFRGDCWQEWNYWHTMLSSQTQGFNISNQ